MSSNQYIPVKNTFSCIVVVYFACELILLSYVVFYLVRAVHLPLALLYTEHLTYGD